jgi:hypothetical protein
MMDLSDGMGINKKMAKIYLFQMLKDSFKKKDIP